MELRKRALLITVRQLKQQVILGHKSRPNKIGRYSDQILGSVSSKLVSLLPQKPFRGPVWPPEILALCALWLLAG